MQYTTTSKIILTNFAANYDCNAYGAGTYNTTNCSTTGTSPTPGGLADTGYTIIIPAALGLSLILAASILLIKRIIRRRKQHQIN